MDLSVMKLVTDRSGEVLTGMPVMNSVANCCFEYVSYEIEVRDGGLI